MLLTEACRREDLKILAVNTDYRHKRHLENLSVMKGEDITCLYNRSGDIVIKVKDGRLAINREFAAAIEVESLNPEDYELKPKFAKLKKFVSSIPLISKIKKVKAWTERQEMKRVPTPAALEAFKKEDEKFKEQEQIQKQQLKEARASYKAKVSALKKEAKKEDSEDNKHA